MAAPGYRAGIGREYYANVRHELVPFLPERYSRVLEVGCGEGVFASLLTEPNEYWGVEPNRQSAERAAARLHRVFPDFFDRAAPQLPERYFDLAVCNDVIEHIADPEAFLGALKTKLAPGAAMIASVPNLRHWELLYEVLVKKDWQYRASGGLDRTHLKFFTKKSLRRMFEQAGFTIERIDGINASAVALRRTILRAAGIATLGLLDDIEYPQIALRARLSRP